MRYPAFLILLALPCLVMANDVPPPPGEAAGPNPLADPFSANTRVELPRLPPVPPSAVGLPPPPASITTGLPQNLRVLMIRENGQGLIGQAEAGSISIPASHGKSVLIGGQSYYAEVTKTEIRLYTSAKGMLLWQGSLAGSAAIAMPADTAQVRYVPPLSAGVNPGLGSNTRASSGGSNTQPVTSVIRPQ
jgi:hypothetical protein